MVVVESAKRSGIIMTYKEFDEMLDELEVHLRQEQKKALYPMIATKDEATIEYIRIKILELKRFMKRTV